MVSFDPLSFFIEFLFSPMDHLMKQRQCTICRSDRNCSHVGNSIQSTSPGMSLGENLGEIMEPNKTEIIEPQKILNVSSIPLVETKSDPFPSNSIISEKEFRCAFCEFDVGRKYLAQHIEAHVNQKSPMPIRVAIRAEETKLLPPAPPEEVPLPISMNELKNFLSQQPNPKLNDLHNFHFRKIRAISVISATNSNKRYSDFTLMIWLADGAAYGTECYGTQSGLKKNLERISVHIVYDSLERYFTVNAKGMKRFIYASYDTEDHSVPTRICEQGELIREIKGILLAYGLPPRAIYKRFRKLMNVNLLLEKNTQEEPVVAYSDNHLALLEELKSSSSTAATEFSKYEDDYGHYCG
jgi:hypothetical protein